MAKAAPVGVDQGTRAELSGDKHVAYYPEDTASEITKGDDEGVEECT
jgi:hypothetical protein